MKFCPTPLRTKFSEKFIVLATYVDSYIYVPTRQYILHVLVNYAPYKSTNICLFYA